MLAKFSMGVGDRFARQGAAQLDAFLKAEARGVEITPVWNKSHREHTIVGSKPADQRRAADAAVAARAWRHAYFVDADHISTSTVEWFLDSCDFFTLDVAAALARGAEQAEAEAFAQRHPELAGRIEAAGLDEPFIVTHERLIGTAQRILPAVHEAGQAYRHIRERKGASGFITEVSMDETDAPQSPAEMLVILAALADEGVPAATIAPRFCGEFHKGVDYVGGGDQFEGEFKSNVAVIRHAVERYKLPKDLKLSIHSGSDKFSLYPRIRRVLEATGAGVHLKTAGTTWLEELIGLAEAEGEGLAAAKTVYREAYGRQAELCAPYAAVLRINAVKLPAPRIVDAWNAAEFAGALRHEPSNPQFNPDLRQLLHVGYKVAAEMGDRYFELLECCAGPISRNVTANLFDRHMEPLFLAA